MYGVEHTEQLSAGELEIFQILLMGRETGTQPPSFFIPDQIHYLEWYPL